LSAGPELSVLRIGLGLAALPDVEEVFFTALFRT
jgi:hypothetical protein